MIDKLKAAEEQKLKELQKKLEEQTGDGHVGVVQKLDQLMGNVSELSEVCKPQNVVRRSKVIKVLMKDFFNKNLTKSMRVNGKRLANYN